MGLQVERKEQDGYDVLYVSGDVDLYTSPELRNAILKAIPKTKCESFAVDLSGVGYMDSSGVATLVEGLKASGEHHVTFFLVAPSNPVMKVLQLARLDSVFQIREAL